MSKDKLYRLGTQNNDGSQIIFDSFNAFITHAEQNPNGDRRLTNFHNENWHGARNLEHAVTTARAGLPGDGVKALAVAQTASADYRALDGYRAETFFDTAGAYVDMGRYLSGEPDCMVDYQFQQVNEIRPVVTVACNVAVLASVDADAIRARGEATVAAIQAIETSGRSVEVWADMTSKCCADGYRDKSVRVSVLIKRAGDVFDIGKFMFCMTSPAMFRVFGFNAREGIAHRYRDMIDGGATRKGVWRLTDYPEGTVYMRALNANDDPAEHARRVLVETGLAAH